MKFKLQGLALMATLSLLAAPSVPWMRRARSGSAPSHAQSPALAIHQISPWPAPGDEGDDEDDSGGGPPSLMAASIDLGGGCGLPTPPLLQIDPPTIGNPTIFNFASSFPGSLFFLAVSPGVVNPITLNTPNLGACVLHVDLQQFILLTSTTNSTGGFRFSFTFPNDPAVVGVPFTVQAMVWNAGSDNYSNGVQITVGGPVSSSPEEDDDE